ncbi:MAG: putative ABC transporter permease [Ruminococcus flavefaciens]|nr:putative ABC transporter permease [Ruminococcus flavefaciens]MCM1229322.1 putative ABC transporter permease [Ruminococcus flavefaciens]
MYQAVELGKFVNRGFLNGPYCPIYGFGVIIVAVSLNPLRENIIALYIGSVVLTSALEFITGFVLEKIFNQHWWDYSEEKFNIGGYICLKFSLLWGVACLIVVRLIHPSVEKFINWIPHGAGVIILIIICTGFASDFIVTVMAILHIKKQMRILDDISAEMRRISDRTGEKLFNGVKTIQSKGEELNGKNAQRKKRLEELTARYREISHKKSFTNRRLEHSFPKLELIMSVEVLKKQLSEKISRKK